MKKVVLNRVYSLMAVSGMFLLLISACKKSNNDSEPVITTLSATVQLSGANERPVVVTTGSGTAKVTYDKTKKTIAYELTWQLGNASSMTTAMHFHGSDTGSDSTSSPVEIPITGFATGSSGTISGTTRELTADEESQLLAGKWYVNVHSSVAPAGEIRGNIKLTTTTSTGGTTGGGGTPGY
jgi:hypothetical protein